MTTHSRALPNAFPTSARAPAVRTARTPGVLHPRTLLVGFLIAATIVVALSFALRGGGQATTSAAQTNSVPAGIWTSPAGGPVK